MLPLPRISRIGPRLFLESDRFGQEVALDERGPLPADLRQRPREDELLHSVHARRDVREQLGRLRRRPEPRHHLVGDATEQQLSLAAGVAAAEGRPLLVVLVGPAHVALRVGEVPVERKVFEHGDLAHVDSCEIVRSSSIRTGPRGIDKTAAVSPSYSQLHSCHPSQDCDGFVANTDKKSPPRALGHESCSKLARCVGSPPRSCSGASSRPQRPQLNLHPRRRGRYIVSTVRCRGRSQRRRSTRRRSTSCRGSSRCSCRAS